MQPFREKQGRKYVLGGASWTNAGMRMACRRVHVLLLHGEGPAKVVKAVIDAQLVARCRLAARLNVLCRHFLPSLFSMYGLPSPHPTPSYCILLTHAAGSPPPAPSPSLPPSLLLPPPPLLWGAAREKLIET